MIAGFGRTRRRTATAPALGALLLAALLTGCAALRGHAGALHVRSLGAEPVLLTAEFRSAVFSHDPHAETSFWLSDVPADELLAGRVQEGQVVHIELLWVPRAGSTPMDADATNASIRYVVISRGEVGVYVGAGFALPRGKLGQRSVSLEVRDASLRLAEATPGFRDVLGPARLSGQFSSRRDAEQARRYFVSVSQFVTDALGSSRYVRRPESPVPSATVLGPTSRGSGDDLEGPEGTAAATPG